MIHKIKLCFFALLLCLFVHIQSEDAPNNGNNASDQNNGVEATAELKQEKNIRPLLLKLPDWLVWSVLDNIPELVRGMIKYWALPIHEMNIPAAHRLILVGEPGTGKTTLAYAIGQILDCRVTYIPATSFMGSHRNQTAVKIRSFFNEYKNEKIHKRVIIIDELHKILEHYDNDHYDASETAAALWLALDELENYYPHIIVIATMNSATGIPPEIKSRFHGKIVTIPMPTKKQKLHYFHQMVNHHFSHIDFDDSINNDFIDQLASSADNFSLRDFQALIDTAQMFAYSRGDTPDDLFKTVITAHDFTCAMQQLKNETKDHNQELFVQLRPTIEKASMVTGLILNIFGVLKIPFIIKEVVGKK